MLRDTQCERMMPVGNKHTQISSWWFTSHVIHRWPGASGWGEYRRMTEVKWYGCSVMVMA